MKEDKQRRKQMKSKAERKNHMKKIKDGKGLVMMLMMAVFLAGCGESTVAESTEETQSEEDTGTASVDGMPVITFFDINSGDNQFDDRIAEEIMKRTGVRIEIIDPTDDPAEKANLMLSYGNYPDMILASLDTVSHYSQAGVLVSLDEYMDELPGVTAMYGNTLERLRDEQGHINYLSNWYGNACLTVNRRIFLPKEPQYLHKFLLRKRLCAVCSFLANQGNQIIIAYLKGRHCICILPIPVAQVIDMPLLVPKTL